MAMGFKLHIPNLNPIQTPPKRKANYQDKLQSGSRLVFP
jgi:hypothetical protein